MAEHDDTGITPEVWRDRRPRLDGRARSRGVRRPRARGGRRGDRAGGDGPGRVPRAILLVRDPRDARGEGPRADDRLEALADGRERGTVALDEAGHGIRSTGCACAPTVAASVQLDGVKPMVMDAQRPTGCSSRAARARGCARSSSSVRRRRPRRASTSRGKFARLEFDGTRGEPSVRPATRRSCGSGSSTTPRCCSRPSSSASRKPRNALRSTTRRPASCSTSPSRSSRSPATRRSTCCSASRWRRSACTTRPGRPTSTRPTASRGRDGEVVHRAKLRTTSPRSASRSTAASATRGSATRTSSCGAPRSNDLLLGAQNWQREHVADLYFAGL